MISTKMLLCALAGLVSIDTITTFVMVGWFGAIEINPIADMIGFYGFIALKVTTSLVAVYIIYKLCMPSVPIVARYGVLTLCGVYTLVCASNACQIGAYLL